MDKQNKQLTIAILISVILIGGSMFFTKNNFLKTSQVLNDEIVNNVSIVDGTQIVVIRAKGGYLPKVSNVKADIPTILRFDTSGTFDCSSSVRIPSMNISEILPNTGTKDINLGSLKAGTINGTCGMGMYNFQIQVS